MKKQDLSRRDFLKGAAVGAVSIAVLGVAGCGDSGGSSPASPSGGSETTASPSNSPEITASPSGSSGIPENISETLDCDIVVVGAGNSGLTATVQAAELGAKVVLLEVNDAHGMNTEGLFAVGSHYQQEQDITVSTKEIMNSEMAFFNYRINSLFWKDMLDNSGENIKWLEDNGVLFSGVVDTYGTLGKVPCFHWFVDGSGANLTDPLEAKALSYGVEIRYNTRGNQLIMENDAVAGIYAEKEDGSTLQVNCNGVILASGGYVGNIEKMASLGIPEDEVYLLGPGRVGDGLNMAVEAGGVDRSAKSCFLREASFMHKGWLAPVQSWVIYDGTVIWVNEYGERYVDETCGEETSGCITNAYYTQSAAFAVWGQNAVDAASEDVQSKLAEEIANGNEYVKKYENLADLCSDWGIDQSGLEETINNYNGYCEISSDEEFDKGPTKLITIEAPYYAGDFSAMNMQAIGAIETNRSFQVIRPDKTPVSGLYAVGTDGCMLYGETYTIKVPGSCNANNINSGRMAAKHAVANL